MRDRLFWTVCIPLRFAIALNARRETHWLRAAAALIGYRWLRGLENGNEGVFGGPAWWKEERPLHGVFWMSYALTGNGRLLAMDTGFGMYNWFTTKRAHGTVLG